LIKKSDEPKTNTRSKKLKEEPALNGRESKSKKSKAQETDDEKRRNFLERNRQGMPPRVPLPCFVLISFPEVGLIAALLLRSIILLMNID
jgi:hypothetical protein